MPGRRSIAEGARKRADMLDKRARPVGPLHGIPLAVKDIISTKTMPTTCGSPIYRDHVVGKDAACVTQLVKAGAIVLGKSVTTEFAGGHAGKTHNPHNLRHTPAGSSSGSAAAVADFMVPVGYGTQTAGSVIRPGAFNGVVAYKGTYGWADMTGIKTYAHEPRHAGLLRPRGQRPRADPRRLRPRRRPIRRSRRRASASVRTPWWDMAEPYNSKNIEDAARTLRAAGAPRCASGRRPRAVGRPDQAQNRVMTKEATQSYAQERARFSHLFSPDHDSGRDGRGRRRQPRPVRRRQEAQAASRSASSTRPGRRSTSCWRPRPGRGAGGSRQHRRSHLQPLLDPARHALHRAALQHRSVRPAAVGAADRRRCGSDDQLIAWARWVEASSRDREARPDRLRRHRQACRGGRPREHRAGRRCW